jgi:hypothetical protein
MTKLVKKSAKELLVELYKDTERKSFLKIFRDLSLLAIYHKSFPRFYFSRYLFKEGKDNIKDYFPDDFLYHKFKPYFNDRAVCDVVENKLFFDFYYSQFNVSLPKIVLYNHRKKFVKGSESIEINSVPEFKNLLESIFEQNPSFDSLIIKKTYGSYGGDQVFKISLLQIKGDNDLIGNLYFEVIKSGFLFQETVKQHPELNKLNSSCLNTIRFETFIDKDGIIEIISAYLRLSTSNNFVDNISSGGCQVTIGLQSGKLEKEGYPSFGSNGTQVYKIHPVTKTVFEGFTIPFFAEAKELVLRVASFMPGLRLVGWDMAIGESGPVLIEGNSDYAMDGNDLAIGGYRTNSTFNKVLHEAGYL